MDVELMKMAAGLACFLSDLGFALDDKATWGVEFAHADGRTLRVSRDGKRFAASGDIHVKDATGATHVRSGESTPRITVAPETEPSRFAKAIASRLLPEYTEIFAKVKARVDESNAWQVALERAQQRYIDAGYAYELKTKHSGTGERFLATNPPGDAYVSELRVSPGSVTLELSSLSHEQAMAILAIVHGKRGA